MRCMGIHEMRVELEKVLAATCTLVAYSDPCVVRSEATMS